MVYISVNTVDCNSGHARELSYPVKGASLSIYTKEIKLIKIKLPITHECSYIIVSPYANKQINEKYNFQVRPRSNIILNGTCPVHCNPQGSTYTDINSPDYLYIRMFDSNDKHLLICDGMEFGFEVI
jgi:hypothetical protein